VLLPTCSTRGFIKPSMSGRNATSPPATALSHVSRRRALWSQIYLPRSSRERALITAVVSEVPLVTGLCPRSMRGRSSNNRARQLLAVPESPHPRGARSRRIPGCVGAPSLRSGVIKKELPPLYASPACPFFLPSLNLELLGSIVLTPGLHPLRLHNLGIPPEFCSHQHGVC
jgi:hypothetical protein